jgi:hypothetical protein
MILFIAQGRKIGYVGREVYRYDKDNYLALSVPIPFQCKVEATPDEPVLALVISVEPTMLSEILINLDEPSLPNAPVPRGLYASPMTDELRGAAIRKVPEPVDGAAPDSIELKPAGSRALLPARSLRSWRNAIQPMAKVTEAMASTRASNHSDIRHHLARRPRSVEAANGSIR